MNSRRKRYWVGMGTPNGQGERSREHFPEDCMHRLPFHEFIELITNYDQFNNFTHLAQPRRRLVNPLTHFRLDTRIVGECQALLLNYEKLLVQEFGQYFSLNAHLAVSLQLSQLSQHAENQALREMQTKHYKLVDAFISDFENTLPVDILWAVILIRRFLISENAGLTTLRSMM